MVVFIVHSHRTVLSIATGHLVSAGFVVLMTKTEKTSYSDTARAEGRFSLYQNPFLFFRPSSWLVLVLPKGPLLASDDFTESWSSTSSLKVRDFLLYLRMRALFVLYHSQLCYMS